MSGGGKLVARPGLARPAGVSHRPSLPRRVVVHAASSRRGSSSSGGRLPPRRGRTSEKPGRSTRAIVEETVMYVEGGEAPAPESEANTEANTSTSYSKLYDRLMSSGPLRMHRQVPKPSKEAQMKEENAYKLWLSDVAVTVKRKYFFGRKFMVRDLAVFALVSSMHLGLLWAPATFSWGNLGLCMLLYFVTGCIGITFGYHRMIAHKSFVVPKWLEYAAAYCGALSIQGDPMEWASTHRYHHLHTDTPKDPHSTYEGAWWSHAGWFLDNEMTLSRTEDHTNAKDMMAQPFYRFMQKTYSWHILLSMGLLYAFGGLPALIWGGCVRTCIVWHITWSINSFCHIYGRQEYDTRDLSKNNWLFGLLAWGEGWHNNHHAFEYSARHGLKWWQFDLTWIIIRSLQFVGLAKKVKLPTEAAKAKLAFE